MIYYLPSLYHRSVSEIDIPQGPDAQHFALTSMAKVKKKERDREIPHRYIILSQAAVH